MTCEIAVTGASGFVGGAVVAHAADEGMAVRAVVREDRGSVVPESEVAVAEVGDVAALRRAFDGCRAVVHAAGRMQGDDADMVAVNVGGTRNVLRAAREAGVRRLVLLSTVAVYGEGDMIDLTEDRPLRPGDAYARSKVEAEAAVRAAGAAGAVEAWVLRPTTVYGPGDRAGFTPFLLGLAREGFIPLVHAGEVRFDLVAVEDLAQACVLAATGPPGSGEPLHVTSDEGLTVRDVVERLRDELGLPGRTVEVVDPERPPEGVAPELVRAVAEHRSFAIDRARARLGYAPTCRFPDSLLQC